MLWPRPPVNVEAAIAPGTLYDLGPYPALTPGAGTVSGELWEIAPADLDLTIRTLDAVEGFQQAGEADWYVRALVEARTAAGEVRPAHVYYFARLDELARYPQVPPGDDGICRWRRRAGPGSRGPAA